MLYLLDSNVLIRAHKDYYPLDRIPQFWDWLLIEAKIGNMKMPFEIYLEIRSGNDELREWIVGQDVKDALILQEEIDQFKFNATIRTAYASAPTDLQIDEAGRDPFLVTYGLMGQNRTIVTKEISKPTQTGGRRKLPDACKDLGVRCINDFECYKELDFRIL